MYLKVHHLESANCSKWKGLQFNSYCVEEYYIGKNRKMLECDGKTFWYQSYFGFKIHCYLIHSLETFISMLILTSRGVIVHRLFPVGIFFLPCQITVWLSSVCQAILPLCFQPCCPHIDSLILTWESRLHDAIKKSFDVSPKFGFSWLRLDTVEISKDRKSRGSFLTCNNIQRYLHWVPVSLTHLTSCKETQIFETISRYVQ